MSQPPLYRQHRMSEPGSRRLRVALLGGCGFVGLNIAEALLRQGCDVLCLDRAPLPPAAAKAFAALPGQITLAAFDVTAPGAAAALLAGCDALVLGAAITAGPEREAQDPERILAVNLGALPAMLRAAREAGLRRIINLSSVAAYGPQDLPLLTEAGPAAPAQLYGITKLASEQVGARLATLWGLSFVSLRLSTVFGPWEYATGQRDTLSPPYQVMRRLAAGEAALLPRDTRRDWIYAPDVAEAVALLLRAEQPRHGLYNVTGAGPWSLLHWGQAVAAALGNGGRCAVDPAGANIALHAATDRAPLDGSRLWDEFGWTAPHGLADTARHLSSWWQQHSAFGRETA